MANIPVKWANSGMRGAPVINGVAGALISALRAFLITGFAPTAAVSATVLDGVATIMLPSGQSFEEHAVVLIAGATPAEFNGEARVLSTASDRITVATGAANGAVAGSITVRYAPVGGWEEVFSKTNVSVFRSTDPTGARFYLRVDDTAPTFARVRGYETMSDVDTGTGPFPTESQISGGGCWWKATNVTTVANRWKMFGDGRKFYLAVAAGFFNSSGYVSAPLRGFGDPIAISQAGDPFAATLSCATTSTAFANYGAFDFPISSNTSYGSVFSPRRHTGLGASVMNDVRAFTQASSATSGRDSFLGAFPNAIDGQVKPSGLFLCDQDASIGMRSIIPGVYYIPQSAATQPFDDGQLIPASGALAGRRLMAIPNANSNFNSNTNLGTYLVDVTGPWRERHGAVTTD